MERKRYEKHVMTRAVGNCQQCGGALKGDALSVGRMADDQICWKCAEEITQLVLATEGKVSVPAQFRSDPIAYLRDRDLITA